jgi:hypothetical protein
LREAIGAASSGDQITFAQSLSGATIILDPAKGELLINNKNVNIIGLGAANLAVSGQNQSRVFEFFAGTDSISGLTIENGFVTNDVYLYGKGGGGILNNFSTLTVSDCILSGNNSAISGSYYRYGRGGGIFNIGTLTVSGSTLSGNSATDEGGGIYNDANYIYGGTVTVNNSSTITGNSARVGGGIYNSSTLTVADSTVYGNQAGAGGGIYNGNYYGSPATTTVSSSTLSSNSAVNYGLGGAIFNEFGSLLTVSDHSSFLANTAADGGAIGNYGTLNVRDSTLSSNSATHPSFAGGGAIYTYFGVATVSNSTLSGNSASYGGGAISQELGALTINGCTLSGNSASYGGAIYRPGALDGGTLTVTGGSSLSNYSASVDGGGIYNYRGSVIVSGGSTLSDNSAVHDGGGIYNVGDDFFGGSVTISGGSTLSDNSAGYEGGGLYNAGRLSTAAISGSTLTGNTVSFAGGGIFNASGTLTVSNSSNISSNSAGSEGGGIYNGGAPYTPYGTLYITDSILCGNKAPVGADLRNLGANTLINSDVCGIALAGTTTTVFNFDNNPSVFGQAVTLTAYVNSTGGATPTGTVTFLLDGSTTLGTSSLYSGSATITATGLSVGTHTITAIYNGDANSLASTSATFTQTVLSAQQELAQIVTQVTAMVANGVLDSGNANALITKLNNAITSLNSGNTITGDNQMNAFINQTNAFLKSGKLDSTDAQTLISDIDLAIAAALVSPI